MIAIFGIKSCDTVRKARKFLDTNDTTYQYHDFRQDGLDTNTLKKWVQQIGYEKLLNTRSTSWRQLNDDQKKDVSESSAIDLMLENPTLIKRPVLEMDDTLLVGFKESEYQRLF